MKKHYFENTKTGKRYELIALSPDRSTVTLKGEYSQFTEPYDKERFKALGYKLVTVENPPEKKDAVVT